MKTISIKTALSAGWSKWRERPWYLVGITLALLGLFILASSEAAFLTALAAVLYVGYLTLFLNFYRGGEVVFDDLFPADSRWINYGFLTLIKAVLIILGLLCFVIPGVYLAIRWMFAEMLVIDKNLRPLEALKASSELTAGYRWQLFGFTLVAILIVLLGLTALIVGFFVAIPVLLLATIDLYHQLQAAGEVTSTEDATETTTESESAEADQTDEDTD